MVANRLEVNTDPGRIFQPLGQEADRLFGSAADWVGDGKSLSDRLWLAGKLDRQAIDTTLRQGIATGKDPLKVARDLEDYLLPAGRPVRDPKTGRIVKWKKDETGKLLRDARGRLIPANAKGVLTRTPRSGKGSYAARRLARTEVSRAFNQGVLQAAALNPFVEGAKWNLSGSHKEADECNEHASNHSDGMGPGEYRLDEFPQMPAHPHCLCFATKVQAQDTDAVVEQLRREVGDVAVSDVSASEFSVSRAITLPEGAMGDRLRPALDAIDAVHGAPELPTVGVKIIRRKDAQAVYDFNINTGAPKFIGVGAKTADAEFAFVHETGHFIDHQALGPKRGLFGSANARGTDMELWENAVFDSRARQDLLRLRLGDNISLTLSDGSVVEYAPDDVYNNYLLDRTELFARSYSQWVARRSGNPVLNAQFEKVRADATASGYAEYWDDDDFGPIADAFDTIFRKRGWLT